MRVFLFALVYLFSSSALESMEIRVCSDVAKILGSVPILQKYQEHLTRIHQGIHKARMNWTASENAPDWHMVEDVTTLREELAALIDELKASGDFTEVLEAIEQIETADLYPSDHSPAIVQRNPSAYGLKRHIAREILAINRMLPKSLQIPIRRPNRDSDHRERLVNQATQIVTERSRKITELFDTTGHADYAAYVESLRASEDAGVRDLVATYERDQVEIVIRRPESGRWWIPKVGFQNQFVTQTSGGLLSNDRRNEVESDYSGIPLPEYAALPAELKPKYGTMMGTPDSPFPKINSSSVHYGGDIYVLKPEIRDRTTFSLGDSLNRHPRSAEPVPIVNWDQIFIPWSHRLLMVPFHYRRAEALQMNRDTKAMHSYWYPGSSYPEVQIFGPLELKDVQRFEFTRDPPEGEFLEALKARSIEIWDRRNEDARVLFWSPLQDTIADLNAWDDESDRTEKAAAKILALGQRPSSIVLEGIERFAFGPPRLPAPVHVIFSEPPAIEKLKLLRRLNFERFRRQVWEKLFEWLGNEAAGEKLFQAILSESLPGWTSTEALRLLQSKGQLTAERLQILMRKTDWKDPHSLIEGDEKNRLDMPVLLVRSSEELMQDNPAWEWVPVLGLFSARREVRELSINALQRRMQLFRASPGSFRVSDPKLINFGKRGLNDGAAAQYLSDHFSELRGFARETALEILRATKDVAIPRVNGTEAAEMNGDEVWMRLLDDIPFEAREFALSPGQATALDRWTREGPSDSVLEALEWGPTRVVSSVISNAPLAIEKLEPNPWATKFQPTSDHSMPDLQTYLENRLGREALSLIRARQVDPIIFAGTQDSLFASRLVNPANLRRLPSPYSTWGIEKYLDTSSKRPKLVFRIPANLELARHYEAMINRAHQMDMMVLGVKGHSELGAGLSLAADEDPAIYMVNADREKYREHFASVASHLVGRLNLNDEKKVDHMILGYEYAWGAALENNPYWKLLAEQSVEGGEGDVTIRLRLLTLESRKAPGVKTTLLIAGSDKTIWGEASRHLVEGVVNALPARPKTFNFLGSAGSPGTDVQYGISFPAYFTDRSGDVVHAHHNFLNAGSVSTHISGRTADGTREFSPSLDDIVRRPSGYFRTDPNYNGTIILQHGVHGTSYSPAEQTREFIEFGMPSRYYYQQRVHTVDVETNLLAQWILENNQSHSDEPAIRFGVGHLLTDNPAGHMNTRETENTLSSVDRARKQAARTELLSETLKAIHLETPGTHGP